MGGGADLWAPPGGEEVELNPASSPSPSSQRRKRDTKS